MNFIETIWADPLIKQYYILAALLIIPVAQIMRRAGFSPFWAVLMAVPGIGWILCILLLALRKWPHMKGA